MAETCPRCGYVEVEADTCPSCKVSISQFRALLLQRQQKRSRERLQRIRKALSPNSSFGFTVLLITVVALNAYLIFAPLLPLPSKPGEFEQWEPAFHARRVEVFWAWAVACGAAVVVQSGTLASVLCTSAVVADRISMNPWSYGSAFLVSLLNIVEGEASGVEMLGLLVLSVCTGVVAYRVGRKWRKGEPFLSQPIDDVFALVVLAYLAHFALNIISAIIGGWGRLLGYWLYICAGLTIFGLWRVWRRGEMVFPSSPRRRFSEHWGGWKTVPTAYGPAPVVRKDERPLTFFFYFSLLVLLALGLLAGALVLTLIDEP